jgi:uncharacterized protein (UPF0276 family)
MFKKPDYCLGVGVNFRNEIADDLMRHLHHFDFIEIGTERFFLDQFNPQIAQLIKEKPIVLHGLTLSIGTMNKEVSTLYMKNLSSVLQSVNCEWFSEHIAATNVNGLEIRSLMPVDFTEEAVQQIAKNAKKVMSLSSKPFLLENITYYYNLPSSIMTEAQFIKKILNTADCGMLLDLNNLYINAINHRYDPYAFINELPLEHIVEVHLAGCDYMHNMLVDTHASSIRKDVLNLFEYLCSRTAINGVVIERDARLNHFSDLLNEVQIVKDILKTNRVFKRG